LGLKLSIVIVNYNVKYFLEQCLYSVRNACKNLSVEVFVVDNNSVDGSIALVKEKFPEVILIANKSNTGFAVANNQAMRLARGEYVLLLNPDTVVQEDTFQKCLSFMDEHTDAGGLGIKMVDGKGNFLPESKRGLPTPSVAFYKIFGLAKLFPNSKKFGQYHLTYLNKNQNHSVDVLSGAFMLMRKSVLDKIGLLDETFFMYGEDIDLSYRITQAGYKNYYFSESSIIHYKGESTKKSSVNYVIVFYKAMAIFAKKHFSSQNARLFDILIHLAIYLRATIAIVARFIKQLFFPAIDFLVICLGLFLIKDFYETHFKSVQGFYSQHLINYAFPAYTLVWMTFAFLSGGYDAPLKLSRIIRGVLVGSAFILIGYSLLPEAYRFSRALILLGTSWALLVYTFTRLLYRGLNIKRFRWYGKTIEKRIAIVGDEEEFNRVSLLLQQTKLNPNYVAFVSNEANGVKHPKYIGHFYQISEIISIHQINEIIFCAKNISSQNIIQQMLSLVTKGVEFKIAPPESLSIIGSSHIDTAGDLYMIDINNVGRSENRRKKRLFDISISILVLVWFPILIWIQTHKGNFLVNAIKVLLGLYSWVGYGKAPRKDLPALKPSVLTPATGLNENVSDERFNKMLLNYSKDYQIENDIQIIWQSVRFLGV
jgi:O-antigen biosynthesis protein